MGAAMFGLHEHPDDPDWRGWWGDEPPFRVPVFVLTHTPRASIEMAGGTTFHFLTAPPKRRSPALSRWRMAAMSESAAARPRFATSSGPASSTICMSRSSPILLGRGVRLWDDLRGLEVRLPGDLGVGAERCHSRDVPSRARENG